VWLVTREAVRLQISERARIDEQAHYLLLREELVKEKENFVAIALHEINTPLTLLGGYVTMLISSQTLEEAQLMADAIRRTSGRFSVMKTLFDARLHHMHLDAFDLCGCVETAVADQWLYVATRKQPGEVQILSSCEGPLTVEADYEKVRVAIWELVRNALKAVEPGDGRITVTVTSSNGHAIIIVEDNGIGITPAYRERIWEAGSQFYEDMTTRRNEGTGHGLYTVRHIMDEHGGVATLDWTEEGVGSRFILYLPRQ
jgi:signal transduction histidine kinase